MRVVTRSGGSGKAACIAAAERLEQLAKRYRLLAETENPAKCDVQDKINRIPAAELP